MAFLSNIKDWIATKTSKLKPGKHAINGASNGVLAAVFILYVLFSLRIAYYFNDAYVLLFFLIILIFVYLGAYGGVWLLKKVNQIPKQLKISLAVAIPLAFFALGFEFFYVLCAITLLMLFGGAINVLIKYELRSVPFAKRVSLVLSLVLSISGFIAALWAYLPTGFDGKPVVNALALNAQDISHIQSESPSKIGNYSVKSLTYGSGKDKHRSEFAKGVAITTESVNGVAFLDNWKGFAGWYREQYWGFDDTALPLNAYVWYPEGEGPFPVVLTVHGNHSMQDYSDDGYGYLGELLASRGYIFASVDQNFINFSWSEIGPTLQHENDARGWLLLEHMRLFHEWNEDSSSVFYNKVDTNNLALIGHSRGGEAVAHAALLNTMPVFYDDASIPLGYDFNIKSIVAIAPVDGQYKPGKSLTSLEDISYFVIHGAQDADVTSYVGTKQYERAQFSQASNKFKAGLYVVGANHGQFNTGWGDNDTGGFVATGLLNNKVLLPSSDQENIAKVLISAFLDATLKDKQEYLQLFVDPRSGRDWLPDTIMVNQFEAASFEPMTNFNHDFDLTTTSIKNGIISGEHLTMWREESISLKSGVRASRAALIAWHKEENELQGSDNPNEQTPSFSVTFPEGFQSSNERNVQSDTLVFSIAESTENTNPKASGKWVRKRLNLSAETEQSAADNGVEDEPKLPIDFSVVVEDVLGNQITFPLSTFAALQPIIETQVLKSDVLFGNTESEMVFQTFTYPFEKVTATNPGFDIKQIKRVSFVFDKTSKGAIAIESIGLMNIAQKGADPFMQ